MISTITIELPSHWPHVSEPETRNPATPPAWTATSSNTAAKVAVRNTSSKWPPTTSLLRLSAATGPRCSLLITGANKDRKSTRLNSSHANISYAVFCLKKKKIYHYQLK